MYCLRSNAEELSVQLAHAKIARISLVPRVFHKNQDEKSIKMATRSPSTKQVLTAPTNSKRISMRGSIIGTTARRDMIEMQLALDREVFDPTLGCPLSSFEGATLGLIGGKALSLWRLSRHGFPVPTAFVIPTYVYSLHISEAGVAQLINDVYTADLNDEQVRDSMKPKLQTIREKIMVTPLNP